MVSVGKELGGAVSRRARVAPRSYPDAAQTVPPPARSTPPTLTFPTMVRVPDSAATRTPSPPLTLPPLTHRRQPSPTSQSDF